MSFVHRIPPVISALAFGYGVGMAAPESTISSVEAAVTSYGAPLASSTPAASAFPRPGSSSFRTLSGGFGGDESRELLKLRATATPAGAASCELDRPTYSRAPRYESRTDQEIEHVEDLDSAGTEALSKLQLPDLRLSVTRRTLKYVRFFTRTEKGRNMFETWLKRSGRYQELIQTELRERRLPEDLMWVAMIESGFDPRAKSSAGAVGLWQFMPATGEVYSLIRNKHIDQRKNPRLATRAAAHHLLDLYRRFGNWDLVLAAYNMGYEQLLDAIDRYGTGDFNELARQEALPSETSAYVPKIAAAAIVANNLEHFGFERVEVARPVDAGEIAVPPATPLATLAKAAGVSTSIIRNLNPDILGDRVPPGRGDYLLMVPADTVSRARVALPVMVENEPIRVDEVASLEPVDSLEGRDLLRRRERREEESLLGLLPHPRHRGTLRSPYFDDSNEAADEDHERPVIESDADGPRLLARRSRKRRETVLYRVTPGDTIGTVARQFGLDVDDVSRGNHLEGDGKLRPGSLLKLRVRGQVIDELGAGAPAVDDGREGAGKHKGHDRRDSDPRATRTSPHKAGRRDAS